MNLARKIELNEDILIVESLRDRLRPAMEAMNRKKRGPISKSTLEKMRIIVAEDERLDKEE